MIRIKQGTVGYWDGVTVVPYTAANGDISLSPEAEAHFVGRGVAEYVGEAPAAGGENNPDDNTPTLPAYSEDMKATELRAIGEAFGLTFKVGMSKAAMVKALDEYFADAVTDEEAEDDGEAAPTFDSTDAVR